MPGLCLETTLLCPHTTPAKACLRLDGADFTNGYPARERFSMMQAVFYRRQILRKRQLDPRIVYASSFCALVRGCQW